MSTHDDEPAATSSDALSVFALEKTLFIILPPAKKHWNKISTHVLQYSVNKETVTKNNRNKNNVAGCSQRRLFVEQGDVSVFGALNPVFYAALQIVLVMHFNFSDWKKTTDPICSLWVVRFFC